MTDAFSDDDDLAPDRLEASIDAPGVRLDKALSDAFPQLSRARLQTLLADGAVTRDGVPVASGSGKALPGLYVVTPPPVAPARLVVVFE